MYDYAIVGGGIVGLATALALGRRFPSARILLLEKEDRFAIHQTGHNSGVIHSGVYYRPGSFKARFCREGARQMVEFCKQQGIAHRVTGKVIVATELEELPRLENLYRRGLENGIGIKRISPEEVREIEPYVRCIAGIRVFDTGIADYVAVAQRYAELARSQGAELITGARVEAIRKVETGYELVTGNNQYRCAFLINCAGLMSDRVARLAGFDPQAQIVPFRGEYYELVPERRFLVNTLIYPVPNPAFPFLGVHFTRGIDGSVHAGPNAVLSFKREGYRRLDFDLKDFAEVLRYPGFRTLAARHWDEGLREQWRSLSKAAFVRSLKRLIPAVRSADLIPAPAGVRAQAVLPDGGLFDDFLLVEDRACLHVLNAPSPAATASLAIGQAIADRVEQPTRFTTATQRN